MTVLEIGQPFDMHRVGGTTDEHPRMAGYTSSGFSLVYSSHTDTYTGEFHLNSRRVIEGLITGVEVASDTGEFRVRYCELNVTTNEMAGRTGAQFREFVFRADDTLIGSTGADVIDGYAGNDTLTGNGGGDSLLGGKGDDLFYVYDAADLVIESKASGIDTVSTDLDAYILPANVENLVLEVGGLTGTGNGLANHLVASWGNVLYGMGGSDVLDGGEGDDTLDGGAGADVMRGNGGSDVYLVDNAKDVVYDTLDPWGRGGTVISSIASLNLTSFTGVRFVEFTTTGSHTFTGNAEDNVVTGGDVADTFSGGEGDDSLIGLGGADVLRGGAGSDDLSGGMGADTLDGGSGGDWMSGGTGDDHYVVDDADDRVNEAPDEGKDTVDTTLTQFTLASEVENATFVGTGNAELTGNELDNVLTGGKGNDTLSGGQGLDTLIGGKGDDTYVVDDGDKIVDASGCDTVNTTLASYTLAAGVENLVSLIWGDFSGIGNALANHLVSGSGNDTLDGGAGADLLEGGDGDDVYYFDNAKDSVVDEAGWDTVIALTAKVDMARCAGVEHVIAGKDAALTVVGNDLANLIEGGTKADVLSGGAGNDTLDGGNGVDKLSGGDGADLFLFDAPADGKDTISDFVSSDDSIGIVASGFGLTGASEISAEMFWAGSAAHDADDRFIYDAGKAVLYYDPDGSGARAAVAIASFAKGTVLGLDDFVLL